MNFLGRHFAPHLFPENIFFLFSWFARNKKKIPYQCALPWIAIICGIVAHVPILKGFFPWSSIWRHFFVNVTFMSAIVSFSILEFSRMLVVSTDSGSVFLSCTVSGSAILRSVDARLSVFLDVAAFYILFGVFLLFLFFFPDIWKYAIPAYIM